MLSFMFNPKTKLRIGVESLSIPDGSAEQARDTLSLLLLLECRGIELGTAGRDPEL
jgi:hypothetical protein